MFSFMADANIPANNDSVIFELDMQENPVGQGQRITPARFTMPPRLAADKLTPCRLKLQ